MKLLISQLSDIDIDLLRIIHHGRIPILDEILYTISFATTFVSIAILTLLLIQMIRNRSAADKDRFSKGLAVLMVSAILSFALKNTILRERPFVIFPDIEKLSEAGSSSFPSGHTLEAFAMAFAFATIFSGRGYTLLFFGWASLVAYTRMALGVHYPSDVIVGAVFGICISYLTIHLFDRLKWKSTKA